MNTPVQPRAERAVSPVIGVILMVAITVILAAVIGAFVLEIGDQQETAPNTSFDSDQRTVFFTDGANDKINATQVLVAHAGGDDLDVTQIDAKVAGNASVWGIEELSTDGTRTYLEPVPDHRPTLGTNERVEFSSGEEWNVIAYGTPGPNGFDAIPSMENVPNHQFHADLFNTDQELGLRDTTEGNGLGRANTLNGKTGEVVSVVWAAESGGKTQTLFKYTIQ